LIVLLISSAAIIITVLLYAKQPLQLTLRTAAIILMYLLITNVTFHITAEEQQTNPVVVIDHSTSMKNHLSSILELVSDIDTPHDLLFSQEDLLTQHEPKELGTYTNITSMIEQAKARDPSSVVLITDGNHNYGTSPIIPAEESNAPIYVYGIGEETTRDVSIIDVQFPDYAYRGDSIEITAVTETGGFKTGTSEVILQTAGGKIIATQPLQLSDVMANSRVEFAYHATEGGTTQFKVYTPPKADETSYDNNEYAFSINVLEEKIRVLYYTDHISFSTKFVLRSLTEDVHLSVSAIGRKNPSDFQLIGHGREITQLPDLSDYDVLMFDNINLGRLPWSGFPELVASGKGIVISGTVEGITPPWREMLPIGVASGSMHGKFQLDITEPFSALDGDNIPPFKNMTRTVDAKDDAVIVARANNLPLIAYRLHGLGKIFQMGLLDLGTWHFLRHGLKGEDILQTLLSDVVQFVSPAGKYGRLVLSTKRKVYEFGETAQLTLQAYDRNFRRAGGGDFFVVTQDRTIPFYETSMGRYETSLVASKTGITDFQAQGELLGEELVSNLISIEVLERSIESEQRLNRPLLQRIATVSGGEFHTLDELKEIHIPERTKRTSTIINLNSPITYLVMLTLLILDWIMRRRRGIT